LYKIHGSFNLDFFSFPKVDLLNTALCLLICGMRKIDLNLLTAALLVCLLVSCKKSIDAVTGQAITGTSSVDNYQEAGPPIQTMMSKKVSNLVWGYVEALPASYALHPEIKYPLIIYLHGKGGMGDGTVDDLKRIEGNALPKLIKQHAFPANFYVNGQTYQFIVLAPQFRWWPWSSDVDNFLNFAISNYRVDVSRVYVSGQSMGGGVAWDYVTSYGKRVAAAVPIAGASPPTPEKGKMIAAAGTAIWTFNGANDTNVPCSYAIDYVKYINKNNPIIPAIKTIFPDEGHAIWNQVVDPNYKENNKNIYEWMLTYKNVNIK
jgi:dienelactone hydrolase